MQDTICEKCRATIKIWTKSNKIKCRECGSLYELESSESGDQHINYVFSFVGFECIHSALSSACNNLCPAPGMFCKEHVSDESFKAIENSISYVAQRLVTAEATLEQMKESKKTWLIQEVSGINEQDSSIRKDENGKD